MSLSLRVTHQTEGRLPTTKPVSYTHLDVYKRQSSGFGKCPDTVSCPHLQILLVQSVPHPTSAPVSYTHLDVYKRQGNIIVGYNDAVDGNIAVFCILLQLLDAVLGLRLRQWPLRHQILARDVYKRQLYSGRTIELPPRSRKFTIPG